MLGEPYDAAIEVTGGAPPYRITLGGSLPAGLMLDGATGRVTGVPVEPGRFELPFGVEDVDGRRAEKTIPLYVRPDPLEILTARLPMGREGELYEEALGARGGLAPYAWSMASGALPAGVAIEGDGRIRGVPAGFGRFELVVEVQDQEGSSRRGPLELFIVSRAPMVATSTIPTGRVGESYDTVLAASGGSPPYSWSIESGELPTGVALAVDGSLAGVPEVAGEFAFTALVEDTARRSDAVSLSFTVIAPLAIESVAVAQAIAGRPYAFRFEASGGVPPYLWLLGGGRLPDGLSLEPDGRIHGTTTELGDHPLTARVRDAEGFQQSALFSLRVSDRFSYEVRPAASFPAVCTATAVSYVRVPIEVIESMQIEDLDVAVDVSFNGNNDSLKLILFGPDGTQAPLCGDGAAVPGGRDCLGRNGLLGQFDDDAAPASRPQRPLSAFDGLNPRGTWILRVGVVVPQCSQQGTVNAVSLTIRDDRSAEDYVVVRGNTRNNLLLEPWVRITGGGLDQHDIFLSAIPYGVGPNGVREGGAGDDLPDPVPLTWMWSGAPIPQTMVSADGHVRAGPLTGQSLLVASGGGVSVQVPIYVTPPDWNPATREY